MRHVITASKAYWSTLTHTLRHGILILASVLSACTWALAANPVKVAAFSGSGDGTSGSPYQITNCNQLLEIGNDLAGDYELANNVDCTGVSFDPIGDSGAPFLGNFDGKGNEIKKVTINENADDVGIFGAIYGATITDVRLLQIDITGQGNVGSLVGSAGSSTISYIAGIYNLKVTGSDDNIGGLVGSLGGSSLERSYAYGVNITSSADMVGGLVGLAVGPTTVDYSYAGGNINASATVGGAIGQLGIGPAFARQIYSDVYFVNAGSQVIGNVAFGATAGSTLIPDNSHRGNNTVSPLETWDFDDAWYVRPGNYPGIRPKNIPVLQCFAPSSTDTTITGSCNSKPLLEGDMRWELKYGFDGDTERTALPTQVGSDLFNVTVPNLLPGTDYVIDFRYIDNVGTSPWGRVLIATTASSDIDNDGQSNKEEFKGPNSGDADNDGIADYAQANVTSFKSFITDKYLTLKTACTDNFNTQLGLESSADKDAIFDYPAGLVGFVIRGCTPGATTSVELYHYGTYKPNDYVARKSNGGIYTTLPNATFSNVTIGGESALKLSYTITDGSAYDDDGIADGNIPDPVGIAPKAISTVSAPSTGLGPR